MIDTILSYPLSYSVAILLTGLLALEQIFTAGTPWRVPYVVVLGVVAAWYLVEPVYTADVFALLDPEDISDAFISVIVFLMAFRVATPLLAPRAVGAGGAAGPLRRLPPDIASKLLFWNLALWIVAAAIGIVTARGTAIEALFPNGRAETGGMWTRGGVATGFGDTVMSLMAYLYIVLLANFGVLLVFVDRPRLRMLCIVAICASWPYAFLLGARHVALAVLSPGLLAFLLYARVSALLKVVLSVGAFVAISQIFKIILAYRNLGFDHYGELDLDTVHHNGLNMASELTYIVGFMRNGILTPQWGYGYLADLCQLVPRALWNDKPLIGFDYAIARGFAGADGGVTVTIAQGMIGGGVRQFGFILGAVVVAVLMAVWVRILTQLRNSASVLRTCLYLLGLGLTFNLGRDITLLVLWPFVLAFLGVRTGEALRKTKSWMVSARNAIGVG